MINLIFTKFNAIMRKKSEIVKLQMEKTCIIHFIFEKKLKK